MYVEDRHRVRALGIEAKRPQRLALEDGLVEVDPRVKQKIDLKPAKEKNPHASAAFVNQERNFDIGLRSALGEGLQTSITTVTQLI